MVTFQFVEVYPFGWMIQLEAFPNHPVPVNDGSKCNAIIDWLLVNVRVRVREVVLFVIVLSIFKIVETEVLWTPEVVKEAEIVSG